MGWKHFLVEPVHLEFLVEREPMWDGNIANLIPSATTAIVEREPMWDGNKKSRLNLRSELS